MEPVLAMIVLWRMTLLAALGLRLRAGEHRHHAHVVAATRLVAGLPPGATVEVTTSGEVSSLVIRSATS